MKKIKQILLPILALAIITSCDTDENTPNTHAPVEAIFEVENSSGELFSGEAVKFTNLSENVDAYFWEFGDGQNSTEKEPTHIYEEAGEYLVSLNLYKTALKSATTSHPDMIANGYELVGSTSFTVDILPNKFPSVLKNYSIVIDRENSKYYIGGEEQELPQSLDDISEIFDNEHRSSEILWNFDSIRFINEELIEIYNNQNRSDEVVEGVYIFDADSLKITRYKEDDEWHELEEAFSLGATGSIEELLFKRTAFKYVGFYYDENGDALDYNADGTINNEDKALGSDMFDNHTSIDDFKETWWGKQMNFNKADTVLFFQYDLRFTK